MNTQRFEHEFELDEFQNRFHAVIWVSFEYECGSVGDPTMPEKTLTTLFVYDAKVEKLSGATWDKDRSELDDLVCAWLDSLALEDAQQLVEDRRWLADELLEIALDSGD